MNIADGSLVRRFDPQECCSGQIWFSPDGSLLAAAGESGVVHLWDVRTGSGRGHIGEPKRKKESCSPAFGVFTPDGTTFACGGLDLPVRLGPVSRPEAIVPFRKHTEAFSLASSAAFSPDGRLLALARTDVQLVDPTTGEVKVHLLRTTEKAGSAPWPSRRTDACC